MSEQDNAANTTTDTNVKQSAMKSFVCASPKSDWHICCIALLTAVITVVIYHFVITAVNEYCKEEEVPVMYCSCHQSEGEAEEAAPKKAKAKGKGKKSFLSKLTPEQREHLKTLKTKEERRAYLRSIFKKDAPRGKADAPRPAAPQAK